MSALISEKNSAVGIEAKNSPAPNGNFLALCAFVTGLVPCLLHNFLFCESRIMLATDGKHFLTTIGLLVEYLKQYAGTPLAQKFLTDSQLPGHIILDGPLMSLIYCPVFMLLNHVPTPRDWPVLALGQSIFHGLSAAILSLIVWRLTRSKFFSILAALVFGLYPPAVLQSGHLMSELPVTTILLLLLYCLTNTKSDEQSNTDADKPELPAERQKWGHPYLNGVVAGSCLGIIVLNKPALIPCVLLMCGVGLYRAGSKFRKPLISILTGIALTLIPWSLFSYGAVGSLLPTAQRQPLYNVASGWNTEANGWACNPHAPMTELFTEEDGVLGTAMGIWTSHPQESLRLGISKLSRLCSVPWNDFKGRALGIDENAQILFHRLIIALAAFGAAVFAISGSRYLTALQKTPLLIALIAIAAHAAYVMVECQPRYAFTAMPFAVLLAIFGIWQISRLPFQDPNRRFIIVSAVACALAATAFLLHAENLCSFFNPLNVNERMHVLEKHDRVAKVIDFSNTRTPDLQRVKAAFLLIDGDRQLQKATIQVNGVDLQEKPMSTMHFDSQHYFLYDQLREFGPAMRISVEDFRQWRALPVDPKLINWHDKNLIILTAQASDTTVYGDRHETRYSYLPDYCSYGILAGAPFAAGAESRFMNPIPTASIKQQSILSTKKEPRTTLKDSLRIKLLVMLDRDANAEAAQAQAQAQNPGQAAPQRARIDVSRKAFDAMLWDTHSTDCLHMNKVVLYAARTVAADLPLPEVKHSTHLKIRITGELKAQAHDGDVGLLAALSGSNATVQILGKTPRALSASSKWRKFQISDLVPLSALGGKAQSIQLAFYPCPWMEGQYGVSRRATDALFRNIVVETEATDLPSISGSRLIY